MDSVQHFSSPDRAISLISGQYQSFEFERHYHLDYHFGLITKGQQQFVCAGERYHVGPGDVVVMPPDTLHDGRSMAHSSYHSHVFSIEPEWFDHFLSESNIRSGLGFKSIVLNDSNVFTLLRRTHLALRSGELSQLAQDCLPYESFSAVVSKYGQTKRLEERRIGRVTLEMLRDFLMAHLADSVHLHQLAELCQLTPTQFQRHFKASVGMTPYAWFTRLRLEQAMKLLKTNLSSTEVAHQVGFYDQAHFSKSFKHTFGLTPSQVR
ncbi:AraC family ligand binding domain-containing protein [Marinomonas gallaica]|uniref:AraC family transcriptional regulator n=1 Tax=Marinomonas gallaica TaxID=1806667 RepID=UPI003A9254A7